MPHRVFQAGVGKMGLNHVKTLEQLTADGHDIALCGVCDTSLDALVAFHAQYPHIPAYLVRDEGNTDFNANALPAGIQIIENVAAGIALTSANTLMNCTNNNSHIPVLEDALSLRGNDGKTVIRTVFQEKPFAHTHAAAMKVAQQIRREGIMFSLNSILEFSPIWNDFHRFIAEQNNSLTLRRVMCAYGKDRTQDTRPAQGGWVGLEGIHALDISAVGLSGLKVDADSIEATRGFLAPAASPDGITDFAIDCTVHAADRTGRSVPIHIEGSFAWKEQRRSSLYVFDTADGKTICMQVLFDKRSADGSLTDELRVVEFDLDNKTRREVLTAQSSGNKLTDYYLCTITPEKQHRVYGLDKALSVQKTLDNLGVPARVNVLDAKQSPQKPALPDLADINTEQIAYLLGRQAGEQSHAVKAPKPAR